MSDEYLYKIPTYGNRLDRFRIVGQTAAQIRACEVDDRGESAYVNIFRKSQVDVGLDVFSSECVALEAWKRRSESQIKQLNATIQRERTRIGELDSRLKALSASGTPK